MSDIVERLQDVAAIIQKEYGRVAGAACLSEEAADTITALRSENEKLTKRVEWFTHAIHTCHDECDRPLCKTTRERDTLRALNAELVEALKAVRFNLVQGGYKSDSIMVEGIDALIARAEGR